MNVETLRKKLAAAGCVSNDIGTLVVDSRTLLQAHISALGEIERLGAELEKWTPIGHAPLRGSFLVAAWDTHRDEWVIGEAMRDPDDPDLIWWASQRGEHYADHLRARGLIPLFCQPLPSTATLPNPPAWS